MICASINPLCRHIGLGILVVVKGISTNYYHAPVVSSKYLMTPAILDRRKQSAANITYRVVSMHCITYIGRFQSFYFWTAGEVNK